MLTSRFGPRHTHASIVPRLFNARKWLARLGSKSRGISAHPLRAQDVQRTSPTRHASFQLSASPVPDELIAMHEVFQPCQYRRSAIDGETREAREPTSHFSWRYSQLVSSAARATGSKFGQSDPYDRVDVSWPVTATVRVGGAHTTRHAWAPPKHEARAGWFTLSTTSIAMSRSTPSGACGGTSSHSFGCKPPEPSHRAKNWHQTGTGRARNHEGLATA